MNHATWDKMSMHTYIDCKGRRAGLLVQLQRSWIGPVSRSWAPAVRWQDAGGEHVVVDDEGSRHRRGLILPRHRFLGPRRSNQHCRPHHHFSRPHYRPSLLGPAPPTLIHAATSLVFVFIKGKMEIDLRSSRSRKTETAARQAQWQNFAAIPN